MTLCYARPRPRTKSGQQPPARAQPAQARPLRDQSSAPPDLSPGGLALRDQVPGTGLAGGDAVAGPVTARGSTHGQGQTAGSLGWATERPSAPTQDPGVQVWTPCDAAQYIGAGACFTAWPAGEEYLDPPAREP